MYISIKEYKGNEKNYYDCAGDFFKGLGPWGSPFTFTSYGITYSQMLDFARLSVEFVDFIIDFIVNSQNHAATDIAIKFLLESWLTLAEIKDRAAIKIDGR